MALPTVSTGAQRACSAPPPPSTPVRSLASFSAIYHEWFESVLRWTGALGAPAADRKDIAQDVFLVGRRRLYAFHGDSPAAWLYRITKRQVGDFRRCTWIRSIFTREHTDAIDSMPNERAGPAGRR